MKTVTVVMEDAGPLKTAGKDLMPLPLLLPVLMFLMMLFLATPPPLPLLGGVAPCPLRRVKGRVNLEVEGVDWNRTCRERERGGEREIKVKEAEMLWRWYCFQNWLTLTFHALASPIVEGKSKKNTQNSQTQLDNGQPHNQIKTASISLYLPPSLTAKTIPDAHGALSNSQKPRDLLSLLTDQEEMATALSLTDQEQEN